MGGLLLAGETLAWGSPSIFWGGQLLFGRERGSCFVWLPKPEGEERCVGEEGKGLLQRLSPPVRKVGRRPPREGDGDVSSSGQRFKPQFLPVQSVCFPALLKWFWGGAREEWGQRKEEGRHW